MQLIETRSISRPIPTNGWRMCNCDDIWMRCFFYLEPTKSVKSHMHRTIIRSFTSCYRYRPASSTALTCKEFMGRNCIFTSFRPFVGWIRLRSGILRGILKLRRPFDSAREAAMVEPSICHSDIRCESEQKFFFTKWIRADMKIYLKLTTF